MPSFDVEFRRITTFEVGGESLFNQIRKCPIVDKFPWERPEEVVDGFGHNFNIFNYELWVDINLNNYWTMAEEESDIIELFKSSVSKRRRDGGEVYARKDSPSINQATEIAASRRDESVIDGGQPSRRIGRPDRGRRRLQR